MVAHKGLKCEGREIFGGTVGRMQEQSKIEVILFGSEVHNKYALLIRKDSFVV